MSGVRSTLIVCRDWESLAALNKLRPVKAERYVVASDDARVRLEAASLPWVADVRWLDRMESFYSVAGDVIRITEEMNRWLKTLADEDRGFPSSLLFFPRSAEGGMTTQRIQDALLLIRSYLHLIESCDSSRVLIVVRPGFLWEDEVLAATARAKRLSIQRIESRMSAAWGEAKSAGALYARAAYYAVNVARIGAVSRRFGKDVDPEGGIVFQLCSSAHKHVENIVPLMKALKDRCCRPIALCWHSRDRYTRNPGSRQIRREKLEAHDLERFCSITHVLRSLVRGYRTWRAARGGKEKLFDSPALEYQGVRLGPLLWPSVRYFLIVEAPEAYRFRIAINRYFERRHPVAVKLWGATGLSEGYLAWECLSSRKERPLFFFYTMGANIDWPYDEPSSPVDLLFVPGEVQRSTANSNVPAENIFVCGQARYDGLTEFRARHAPSESRRLLGIPENPGLKVLYDHNIALRGFLSERERASALSGLLQFADSAPEASLLIKPHPSDTSQFAWDGGRRAVSKNVFLIEKTSAPYHALNATDLLITKYSTIGIEAMLFERPVICCALDGERRIDIYKGASEFLCSVEELKNLLSRLAGDDEFRVRWVAERLIRQKAFLARYFTKMPESAASVQARILLERLRHPVQLRSREAKT